MSPDSDGTHQSFFVYFTTVSLILNLIRDPNEDPRDLDLIARVYL